MNIKKMALDTLETAAKICIGLLAVTTMSLFGTGLGRICYHTIYKTIPVQLTSLPQWLIEDIAILLLGIIPYTVYLYLKMDQKIQNLIQQNQSLQNQLNKSFDKTLETSNRYEAILADYKNLLNIVLSSKK